MTEVQRKLHLTVWKDQKERRGGNTAEEEVSVSERVTVTALTEKRGESFIKAAHDFMTVTYLYRLDLTVIASHNRN